MGSLGVYTEFAESHSIYYTNMEPKRW